MVFEASQHARSLISRISKERNDLVPFNRLPPELAGTILSWSLPEPPYITGSRVDLFPLGHGRRGTPHSEAGDGERYQNNDICGTGRLRELASVSTKWRQMIKFTPGLWTTIGARSPKDVEAVRLKLHRSRSLPIDVPPWALSDEPYTTILTLVFAQASRFRSVRVDIPDDATTKELVARALAQQMPFLERMVLNFDGSTRGGQRSYFPVKLGGGPAFFELHLHKVLVEAHSPGLATLRKLTLSIPLEVEEADLLPLLASTPNLRYLAISNPRPVLPSLAHNISTRDPVTLPYLEQFDSTSNQGLFCYIHAPLIQSLRCNATIDLNYVPTLTVFGAGRMLYDFIHRLEAELLYVVCSADKLSINTDHPSPEKGTLLQLSLSFLSSGPDEDLVSSSSFATFAAGLPPVYLSWDGRPDVLRLFPTTVSLEIHSAALTPTLLEDLNSKSTCPNLQELCVVKSERAVKHHSVWVKALRLRADEAREGRLPPWSLFVSDPGDSEWRLVFTCNDEVASAQH